ncbi:hypothetical protein ECEC1864_2460, partial [Escherichia coli EC1864]
MTIRLSDNPAATPSV